MSESASLPRIKPLGPANYPQWSGEMKAWLMRAGLWRLVSGVDKKPVRAKEDTPTALEMELEIKWEDKA